MMPRFEDLKVEYVPLDSLKPYDGNAKKHTREQIDAVEASIREFGFRNPIIAWHNDDVVPEIVAGHARAKAAQNLGMKTVPVIFADDLSDAQRRALTLVDNQTTMMTGWDEDQLAYELDILSNDFDMSDFGFELDDEEDDTYTQKTEGLIYEPTGFKPSAFELADTTECDRLKDAVNDSNVSKELKDVLIAACYRFVAFDYSKIADYYANGTDDEKAIIEALHMVIVDRGSKIEKAANEFIDEAERIIGDVWGSDPEQ